MGLERNCYYRYTRFFCTILYLLYTELIPGAVGCSPAPSDPLNYCDHFWQRLTQWVSHPTALKQEVTNPSVKVASTTNLTPGPGYTYPPGKVPTQYPGQTFSPGKEPTLSPYKPFPPDLLPTKLPNLTPGFGYTYPPGKVPTQYPGQTFSPGKEPTLSPYKPFPPDLLPTKSPYLTPGGDPWYTYPPGKVPTPLPGYQIFQPPFTTNLPPTKLPYLTLGHLGYTWLPGTVPTPYPEQTDYCIYKHHKYLKDEEWNDGCHSRCRCTGDGVFTCNYRCAPINQHLSEGCSLKTDPQDSCCMIQVCSQVKVTTPTQVTFLSSKDKVTQYRSTPRPTHKQANLDQSTEQQTSLSDKQPLITVQDKPSTSFPKKTPTTLSENQSTEFLDKTSTLNNKQTTQPMRDQTTTLSLDQNSTPLLEQTSKPLSAKLSTKVPTRPTSLQEQVPGHPTTNVRPSDEAIRTDQVKFAPLQKTETTTAYGTPEPQTKIEYQSINIPIVYVCVIVVLGVIICILACSIFCLCCKSKTKVLQQWIPMPSKYKTFREVQGKQRELVVEEGRKGKGQHDDEYKVTWSDAAGIVNINYE